ncbi:heavy metal-binding protein HIP-like [Mytilus californianus]|uniref:heavy metal-binding protein HIP-like n=1 Tax=Mytilus californianus TaxID=6549 RepID=UPI002246BEF5|nr:heavy metal-binding protein HIP-like [Mytilus californianus]
MKTTGLLVTVMSVLSARASEKSCDSHKLSIKEPLANVKHRLEEIEHRENDHTCKFGGTRKKNVAFRANLGTTLRNLSPKAVVVVDQIVLNIGKAYNTLNGLFTCPEDGVYSFTWAAMTSPNSSFESDFVVNGKIVAGNLASSHNDNEYQPTTKTVVVQLKKGDKANVATLQWKFCKTNTRFLVYILFWF